jgi:hypothetical protein
MPMSYFTEEALKKFNELCAQGVDFGEGPVYDFAKCVKPDGDVYGVEPGEKCDVGRPLSDGEAEKKGNVNAKMSKLKRAFIKKLGRDMTSKELAKARNRIASVGVKIPQGESAESMLQKMLPKGEKVIPVKEA